jgi:hypothetical protein
MFKLWGGCDSLDHQALANYLQLKIHPVATYLSIELNTLHSTCLSTNHVLEPLSTFSTEGSATLDTTSVLPLSLQEEGLGGLVH